MKETLRHALTRRVGYTAFFASIIAVFTYGWYNYDLVETKYRIAEETQSSLTYSVSVLSEKLKASEGLNEDLKTLLRARNAEKEAIGQQVQTLSTNLSTLDKLVHTDHQLLEKYSSVYFLNENYSPEKLTPINSTYLARPEKEQRIITIVLPHLEALLQAAARDGVSLSVLSAYRSYGEQSALKSAYKVTYGSGTANSFSADQGYSEHQLGTTVDFVSNENGGNLQGFDKTAAYTWLTKHAHLYGFNLSYPKGNSHFVYEPWHWRFVGIALSKRLYEENKTLYDLDQREIDSYLLSFDLAS
jgi:zinc D-Ala-D-Ala carboxypeptidase